MRTVEWALVLGGVAVAAAGLALLGGRGAAPGIPSSAPVETRRKVAPTDSSAPATPREPDARPPERARSSPAARAADPAGAPAPAVVAVAAATTASKAPLARDMDLDAILDRLEALAGGAAEEPGSSLLELAAELRRRFPEARLRTGLYEVLRRRPPHAKGLEQFLPDGDLVARLRRVAADAAEEPRSPTPVDSELLRLTMALAGREALKDALVDELAAHPDARVRRSAAILAQWPRARPDVLRILARDAADAVRGTAYYMIGALLDDHDLPGKDVEELVFAGLSDPFDEVRETSQNALRHLGAKGAEEAVRILRSGAHREVGNGPGELVQAALAGAPARLLAEPLSQELAEDIACGCAGLAEDHPELVRLLVPHVVRIVAAMPPEAEEAARYLLPEFCRIGEAGPVREVLRSRGIPAGLRKEAAKALLENSPAGEWEEAVTGWLRDAGVEVAARKAVLVDVGSTPGREPDDATRGEVQAAWVRVLRAVAQDSGDSDVPSEAARLLASLPKE